MGLNITKTGKQLDKNIKKNTVKIKIPFQTKPQSLREQSTKKIFIFLEIISSDFITIIDILHNREVYHTSKIFIFNSFISSSSS